MSKAKVVGKELAAQVDRLGVVRAEKAKLVSEESELAKVLRENIGVGNSLAGETYEATVASSTTRTVNTKKVLKIVGQEKFNQIATVPLSALEKIMGLEEIDRVVETEDGTPRVNVKKIKG